MEIPDTILKCVAFIAINRNSPRGDENYHLLGTVFFVGYPINGTEGVEDSGGRQVYAVTAKHIIDRFSGSSIDANVYLRVNARNPKVFRHIPIPLAAWEFDDDARIDVAVASLPDYFFDNFDHHYIPVEMFGDSERPELVSPGGDLFFPGLFSQRHGDEANIPIMRTGTVAAMPGEAIRTEPWSILPSAYLIDTRSIGGMSGSPVFSCAPYPRFARTPTNPTVYALLGIVHGHYVEPFGSQDAIEEVEGDSGKSPSINAGIAIVVPISCVREVLEKPVLVEQRERLRQQWFEEKKKDLPVAD